MMRCPVCSGDAWRIVFTAADMYTGRPYVLSRCDHCGLVQTTDGSESSSNSLYLYGVSPDAGKRFGPMQWVLRAFRNARVSRTGAGMPGRALDVGCGDGSFLMALARQGWDVFGTELSEAIATTAQQRLGDRIYVGAIEDAGFAGTSFDLITFWHVLEHLDDPAGALAEARRLMKAGGRLVVAVPNIESWQARLFKQDWLHLDVPRHRWHFSARTLAALADRCHFRVESIRHFSLEYGPFAMLQGIATKAGLGHSLFTRLARLAPSQLVREPLFWAHLPLVFLAVVPSFFFELAAAICGRGGAVTMVCSPKE